jgi:hypothetical protein
MKVVVWFLSLGNYGLHMQAKPTDWAGLTATGGGGGWRQSTLASLKFCSVNLWAFSYHSC